MTWSEHTRDVVGQVVASTNEQLLLCSPFVSRAGLDFVSDRLHASVRRIEVWTRLEMRDWMTQASDAEALADFIAEHEASREVVLLTSPQLHAKLVVGDGGLGAAGSANITWGGLGRNVEILRLVSGAEMAELEAYIERVSPLLSETSKEYLEQFLAGCAGKRADQLALVDIIREYSPPPPGPGPLLTIKAFEQFCRDNPSYLTDRALAISTGRDLTNRTGHIHQAFFAAQRFLQENPRFLQPLLAVSLGADFDPDDVPGLVSAWIAFLNSHLDEAGQAPLYPYAFESIKRHLTATYGGTRTGGSGWNPPFRLAWPIAARMMTG